MVNSFPLWFRFQMWPLFLGAALIPIVWSRVLNDNYTEAKWLALRLTAGVALTWLAVRKQPVRLPSFSGAQFFFLGLWVVLSVLNPILQQTYFWSSVVWLDRGVLLALVVAFSQFRSTDELYRSLRWPICFAAMVVCAISFVQFVLFRIVEFQPSSRFFAGTFGENNMCAQFLVLALPFAVHCESDGIHKYWRPISAIVSVSILTFIFLHQSRSALIGAGLVMGYFAVTNGRREVARLIVIAAVAVSACLGLGSIQRVDFKLTNKTSSNSDRMELYVETVEMIRSLPLGVGSGRFEFDSIPFLSSGRFQAGEGMIYKSPHSEPLRFLAEEGVIWSTLSLVAIAFIVLGNLSGVGFQKVWTSKKTAPATALGLAVLPEFFFQFPLQNAVPIFFVGILISRLSPTSVPTDRYQPWVRLTMLLGASAIFYFSAVHAVANYRATTAQDPTDYAESCGMDDSNWYVCTLAAQHLIEAGDSAAAVKLMVSELKKRPFNFVALRNLGMASWRDGDQSRACEYFQREQAMLRTGSSNQNFVSANCELNLLDTLMSENPKEFYRTHLKWVNEL